MTADRPTIGDVQRAARSHTQALSLIGLAPERYEITRGSRTYGYQWEMYPIDAETGTRTGSKPSICRAELGFTARDAYDTIVEATRTVRAVRRAMLDAGHVLPVPAEEVTP
jgi:hypothetical protein